MSSESSFVVYFYVADEESDDDYPDDKCLHCVD